MTKPMPVFWGEKYDINMWTTTSTEAGKWRLTQGFPFRLTDLLWWRILVMLLHQLDTVNLTIHQFPPASNMWILLILITSVTGKHSQVHHVIKQFNCFIRTGARNKLVSTCPSSEVECSTRDSSHWKCCPNNEIAFPSVESCTNGTLIQSECFPSTFNVFGGPGSYLDRNHWLFNLNKLTNVYAVKVKFINNQGNVLYENCESIKWKFIF